MLTEIRHQQILRLLETSGNVKLQELVKELNVSESTIRRDLGQLEEEGHLIRIHGGAKRAFDMQSELTFQEKSFKNSHDKNLIAKYAATIVKEHDVIFLDAGTTTLMMIPYLVNKEIVVVTNGLRHADVLMNNGIQTIVLGGQLKAETGAIIGPIAEGQLRDYRFNHVFLGMNGVDEVLGYTTPDIQEAVIKQTAANQSKRAYVLADKEKIGKVNFYKVADIDQMTLITSRLDQTTRDHYETLTNVKECDEA